MVKLGKSLQWLTATALAVSFAVPGSASAFEAHNPIEPTLGSFKEVGGLTVDQANGNLYAVDKAAEAVEVFGPGGGSPAGGSPASFTGAGSFPHKFSVDMGGVAVDDACALRGLSGSACEAFDPSNGDVYVLHSTFPREVDKYRLNGAHEYEYICAIGYYGGTGTRCLPNGGEPSEVAGSGVKAEVIGSEFAIEEVAVDSAGDVYVGGTALPGEEEKLVLEFNAAGEPLRAFPLPNVGELHDLVVSSSGTIYVRIGKSVMELRRSSLTGAVEGQPAVVPNTAGATGIALDQANGELFVDLGSSAEALNSAHEVVSRFGKGIISQGRAIAVDEGTGEGRGDVYVANTTVQKLDVFGPGVPATAPNVEETSPSLTDVTRTSALLSATVDTEKADSTWQAQYVAASEYQPGAANPYAAGSSTPVLALPAAVGGTPVGPVPLGGLLAGVIYHYRVLAGNEAGTTYGPDLTFTTAPATPPVVATGAASEVTQTGVTLSGTVGSQGLQTSYEFEVGTDTSYGGAKLFGNAGQTNGTEAVSASLQFLIPGITYHYRLLAVNEDGTGYGQDMTFTTPSVPAPIAQPSTATLIPIPTVAFPSVAGAITKPRGATKKKTKTKRKTRRKHGGASNGAARKGKGAQGKTRKGGAKAK